MVGTSDARSLHRNDVVSSEQFPWVPKPFKGSRLHIQLSPDQNRLEIGPIHEDFRPVVSGPAPRECGSQAGRDGRREDTPLVGWGFVPTREEGQDREGGRRLERLARQLLSTHTHTLEHTHAYARRQGTTIQTFRLQKTKTGTRLPSCNRPFYVFRFWVTSTQDP